MLFEGSTHGIAAVDMETGRFGYANPSICRMLGYSEPELRQLGIADIHPKDSLDQVMVEFESLARDERAVSSMIPCRRKTAQFSMQTSPVLKASSRGGYTPWASSWM